MNTNTDTDTRHPAPEFLDLSARDVLAVDGTGGPGEVAFTSAIRSLFALRAALGGVADVPLEGTYTQDGDPGRRFELHESEGWHWRLVVPAPAGATAEAVAAAGIDPRARLVRQPAQRVARLLHRGPYAEEGPTLDALYAHVAAAGLVPVDGHTEVYLNAPTTTAPADLRTWLQVPVGR